MPREQVQRGWVVDGEKRATFSTNWHQSGLIAQAGESCPKLVWGFVRDCNTRRLSCRPYQRCMCSFAGEVIFGVWDGFISGSNKICCCFLATLYQADRSIWLLNVAEEWVVIIDLFRLSITELFRKRTCFRLSRRLSPLKKVCRG